MIRVCEPTIDSEDERMVTQAIKEGEISSLGKYVSLFEEKFARWLGVKYAVSVNSGGSALFLALKVLGIKDGDEVVVPDFTMVAVVNAVIQCNAKPILVDCEMETGNIDAGLIEEVITDKTKAIIAVHIYGHPCDMDCINDIARRYSLFVVEDAAEAHGASYKGKITGSLADMACFSFYANKIITTGEGGMIVTDNKDWAEECRDLRAYSFGKENRFLHTGLGWNMRMSSLEAALGLSQLNKVDKLIAGRVGNGIYYRTALKNCLGLTLLEERPWSSPVYWMFAVLADSKNELRKFLYENGVETRDFFQPMHLQPHVNIQPERCFPNANFLSDNGLYLPSSSHLTGQERERVVRLIKQFYS